MGVIATVLAPVAALEAVVLIAIDLDLAAVSGSAAVAMVIVLVHVVDVVVVAAALGFLNQAHLLLFFLVCRIRS